jgi:hypothetical protein
MVHLIDADRAYDHTLEDLLLCNVHTDDDDEDASTEYFQPSGERGITQVILCQVQRDHDDCLFAA